MAIPNVPITDNFELWRQKTNLIAQLEGDLDLLLTVDKTSLVAAINEVITTSALNERRIVVRAMAMS